MKEDKKTISISMPMKTYEAIESLRWDIRQNRSRFITDAIELHVRRMKRALERANEQSKEQ